jgi:transmembrane sensor
MKKQKNIENLLSKFSKGDLSPSEANELVLLVKQGDENVELKEILSSYWLRSTNDVVDIQSDVMLEKLRSGIKAIEPEQDIPEEKSGTRKLFMYLRYAAIVALTFGLSWFARDFKDSRVESLVNGSKNIANNEISVLYGSKSKITLPDGSVVIINSGSTLKYPTQFDKNSRKVFITGEGYFEVTKDKKHPFYVQTNNVTIKVLGTKFNVKSYADEQTVEATLVTGSIELYNSKNEIKDENRLAVLKPNQQATFEIGKTKLLNNIQDSITGLRINDQVDVTQFIAWKDNRLVFRDENFVNLTHKLERWYNVEIEIKDDSLKKTLFSGVFVKESIEQSLNALKIATPFHYTIRQNHIVVTK